jgi:ABC-type multidrug transport system permease subunit
MMTRAVLEREVMKTKDPVIRQELNNLLEKTPRQQQEERKGSANFFNSFSTRFIIVFIIIISLFFVAFFFKVLMWLGVFVKDIVPAV